MFNILGTKGCFYGAEGDWGENKWFNLREKTVLSVEDMRDTLPEEVYKAFSKIVSGGKSGYKAVIDRPKAIPKCPKCGTVLSGDEKFCPECGNKLN
jgi:rubrerythrin